MTFHTIKTILNLSTKKKVIKNENNFHTVKFIFNHVFKYFGDIAILVSILLSLF